MTTKHVPITDIVDNPFQPRTTFDKTTIQSLADEMKAEGFWNGALQARRKDGKIELVYGHRRLRALKLLKAPTVAIELLDLTDAQMALRSLEENLQREGLTDLEKADAVRRAVEIAKAERVAAGKSDRGAVQEVADRLGLTNQWVSALCQISTIMIVEDRPPIEAGHITAKTALMAKEWGGGAYMKTLAKQGKRAGAKGDVPKPTHMTVAAMKKVVKQAPSAVREKLKKAIVSGEVADPKEAERKANRLTSDHLKREKLPPPDLKEYVVGLTHRIDDATEQLRLVAPHMDYVDEAPAVAKQFRTALKQFVESAQKLL